MAARSLRSSTRLGGGGGQGAEPPQPPPGARRLEAEVAPPPPAGEAAARRARAAERAREVEDSPRVLRDKCRRLARALRNAKHLVVYTGAGISTAADIPDYRGPRGVWTRLRRGERVPRVEVSAAEPTFTHMALTALWSRGALKFVVSQNCDGLHVRAGLPRRALAELHGDMFAERCPRCRRVYLRAFDTTERTARHRHATRRLCHACGAELHDTIVHFGERGRAAWPLNWAGALRHAARADVVLCLGSSLKVLRRYPRLWRMHAAPQLRPRLYIVNLQWTPKDAVAELKINARCDDVMRQVARRLRLRVPRYRAAGDPLLAHAEPLAPHEAHTTRRPHLAAPPPPPPAASDTDTLSGSEPGSPSASDSDEEVPLRRLADRLRVPPPPPPPPPPSPPPATPPAPSGLVALQVSLHGGGDATILLRAEHAAPPAAGAAAGAGAAEPRHITAELRRVRLPRRPPPPPPPPDVEPAPDSKLRRLLEVPRARARAPHLEYDPRTNGVDIELKPKLESKVEPKRESEVYDDSGDGRVKVKVKVKVEVEEEEEEEEEEECEERRPLSAASSCSEAAASRSLAAAIIARAVFVCRSVYPGLHTIVPAAARAECAWCLAARRSPRCLWYGPPRLTPAGARACRGRALCACCAEGAPPPDAAGGAPQSAGGGGGGGWYGKGYRKGRRRRR